MPCSSDHYEPHEREKEDVEAANILVMIYEDRGELVPPALREAADSTYGEGYYDEYHMRKQVPELCAILSGTSSEEMKELVNRNFENAASGKLLSWWHRHKEADKTVVSG